jgi:hypothetical protein
MKEEFIRGYLYKKGTLGFQRPSCRSDVYPFIRFRISDDGKIWDGIIPFFAKRGVELRRWKEEIYIAKKDNLRKFLLFFKGKDFGDWERRPKYEEFAEAIGGLE